MLSLSYIFTSSFIYFIKYTIKLNSRNTIFGYSTGQKREHSRKGKTNAIRKNAFLYRCARDERSGAWNCTERGTQIRVRSTTTTQELADHWGICGRTGLRVECTVTPVNGVTLHLRKSQHRSGTQFQKLKYLFCISYMYCKVSILFHVCSFVY